MSLKLDPHPLNAAPPAEYMALDAIKAGELARVMRHKVRKLVAQYERLPAGDRRLPKVAQRIIFGLHALTLFLLLEEELPDGSTFRDMGGEWVEYATRTAHRRATFLIRGGGNR